MHLVINDTRSVYRFLFVLKYNPLSLWYSLQETITNMVSQMIDPFQASPDIKRTMERFSLKKNYN